MQGETDSPGKARLRPMLRIMATIVAVLLTGAWFAAWTFAQLAHVAAWPWILASVVLAGTFIPTMRLSQRKDGPLVRWLNVVSGVFCGFLSFFLIAALASWIAVGVAGISGLPVGRRTIALALYGAGALAGLYALFNAFWLRVTRVTAALPNLPPFWNGKTVALVSDVHLGNFRGSPFSRAVVSRIMDLHAECILVAGDMFDGVRINIEEAVAPWAGLSAPSGVLFVGGNHDDYGGRNAYFAALRRVGMRVLDNERVEVSGLQVVGVHDRESHHPDVFRGFLEKANISPASASILVAHRPSNLPVAEAAGISLQVSGHTHGGQFWPWSLIARRVHGKFNYGLNSHGKMLVYTSSGAGTWGPPFRLGTRSEIVLIRLERAG
jgi:predicted MPP superfamily phosphohydrolase